MITSTSKFIRFSNVEWILDKTHPIIPFIFFKRSDVTANNNIYLVDGDQHVGTSCSTCKMNLLHISLLCIVVLRPNLPGRYIQSNFLWLKQLQIFASWFWIINTTFFPKAKLRIIWRSQHLTTSEGHQKTIKFQTLSRFLNWFCQAH